MARITRRIVSPDVSRATRLPPGQHEAEGFPVLDLGTRPLIAPAAWRLHVDGDVERPKVWDWTGFQALPHVELVADFHCVTSWSALGLRWEGVPVRDILGDVSPRRGVTHVVAHGAEGYTTDVPLAAVMEEDAIVADALDGRPIPRDHGGPVRLIVPRLYAWKSCKFLVGLQCVSGDRPGFWERRGYHARGDPWREERFG